MTTVEKLTKFVNQRPGLDFNNYGDISSYRKESAEITRDRNDYFELLSFAFSRINDLNTKLNEYFERTTGRLTVTSAGNLEYCTGQYFPTEYRPAANRVLANLIWESYLEENIYEDGIAIRKAIKRRVSRRIARYYFN
jgi:hypothetical protein